jgi:predicted transcriptional regulator
LWRVAEELDPSQLKQEKPGRQGTGTDKPNRFQAVMVEVLTELANGPATKRALRVATGTSGTTIKEVVETLLEDGRITHTSELRNGVVTDVYSIPQPEGGTVG